MAKIKTIIKKIKKRDGRIMAFSPTKIERAIWQAMKAAGGRERKKARYLAGLAVKELEERFNQTLIPEVEQVQDLIEQILQREGLEKTYKAYTLYRDLHARLRDITSLVDSDELIQRYLDKADWRVKENANMTYSLQGLNNHVGSIISANFWLNKIYPRQIRKAHRFGDLHIHNLAQLSPYCTGWDLKDLLIRGFGGVRGKIWSKPAKHFSAALGQLVNFFYTVQGEVAGAVAVANFDTYLAPFIAQDGLSYQEVKQAMQEFVYNMGVPTRVGFQNPFSNVTLDLVPPKMVREEAVIVAGRPTSHQYGEFQKEMDYFNRAFAEVMAEGDAQGRVFTFPIPTYSITKDFAWEKPVLEPIFEMTRKYGIPYFANYVNSQMKPEDIRSMCCRLRLNNKVLRKRGGLFAANPLTGCYDEKTEILTEDGWRPFAKLTKKDKVFTLSKTNRLGLHHPTKIFEYDWRGELIRFKAKSLDLLVTPGHRMIIDTTNKIRKFVEAQDFDVNNHRIPKKAIWEGEEREWFILPSITIIKYGHQGRTAYEVIRDSLKIKMDDWLAFLGIWLAEGSSDNEKIAKRHGYRVVISQKNKKKRKEIEVLLGRLPFNYYKERDVCFIICNKQLWIYLRQFGTCYTKFIPQEFKNLNKRQLKILFDWLIKGDGYIRKTTGQINYWTVSKKLADDVQEIIIKLGFSATITEQKERKGGVISGRKIKGGSCYCIGLLKTKHHRLRKVNIRKEFYKGKVYCCEVPNHTVLVRRNGKICWSGNSVGVVTINLPRIGYLAKTKKDFFSQLKKMMDLAKKSLMIKREAVEEFTKRGLYPYCRYYLQDIYKRTGRYWRNHFNTIGIIGMNEALLNFAGLSIADEQGKKFALEVMDFCRQCLIEYQKETGELFNLEATPAEGTAYSLALLDREHFKDIIVANEKEVKEKKAEPFYTNSTFLAVNYTDDLYQALDHQEELQIKYTGGTVFHGFLGESLTDTTAVKHLIRKISQNYRLPYFTLTPTFSICSQHGYLRGEKEKCPRCGRSCEVYSRVVGYLRPVDQWNAGKQEEFRERTEYKIK